MFVTTFFWAITTVAVLGVGLQLLRPIEESFTVGHSVFLILLVLISAAAIGFRFKRVDEV